MDVNFVIIYKWTKPGSVTGKRWETFEHPYQGILVYANRDSAKARIALLNAEVAKDTQCPPLTFDVQPTYMDVTMNDMHHGWLKPMEIEIMQERVDETAPQDFHDSVERHELNFWASCYINDVKRLLLEREALLSEVQRLKKQVIS